MIEYLDLDDLLAAAHAYLGRTAEVSDYGLLESALARPQATVFGDDAYTALHEKAAALFDSLINNHAPIDGNKRLAWVAMRLFYGYNGHTITGTEDKRFDFVLAVATGERAGVPKIAERLASMATRV